jgi:DNA-binding CsgD family transcriptional regulator
MAPPDDLGSVANALHEVFGRTDATDASFTEERRAIELIEQLFPRCVVAFCSHNHPGILHASPNQTRVLGALNVTTSFHDALYAKVATEDARAVPQLLWKIRAYAEKVPQPIDPVRYRFRLRYRLRKSNDETVVVSDEKIAVRARDGRVLFLNLLTDVTAEGPVHAASLRAWEEGGDEPRKVLEYMPEPGLQFSAREAQIAELVAQGRSTKQIASMLGLSANTVRNHRSKILKKAGASNAAQLSATLR